MNTPAESLQRPMDVPLKTAIGRLTHGISPAAVGLALQDWALHLAASPGKQAELASLAQRLALQGWLDWQAVATGDDAALQAEIAADKRFAHAPWRQPPFSLWARGFLQAQQWWEAATSGVRGTATHHQQVTAFVVRQWLDMLSPSNGVFTNPEVLDATLASGGQNLLRGAANWGRDAMHVAADRLPPGWEAFKPGTSVAVTPGTVVFRNRLIELIQYAPATPTVWREPVLMVPSWIMKYYILDLSPHNSMVRWLVEQGHTVFMVSWKNPGPEDRDLGMDDYVELGVMQALQAVSQAQPGRPVHLAGYCLGGTLAAIAAAALARQADAPPLATLTLLAAQTDFAEPGELGLFIDESQIAFLEDLMAERGGLDGRQMAGAFALINSKDLVWSKLVHEYLMGHETPLDDLHAWNADATRMPARMHGEYLRRLYLHNDLAKGRYPVRGRSVSLHDIRRPMFVVATERDHVSPWRSVFQIHRLVHAPVDFALTTGGHNVGIVNPPRPDGEAPHIAHRVAHAAAGSRHEDPDDWLRTAERRPGSWWPTWQAWVAAHSSERETPVPVGGAGRMRLPDLGPAPGTYVLET